MADGHLFVTRGDLTALECDAWLVPTDAARKIEAAWAPHLAPGRGDAPKDWTEGHLRVAEWRPRSTGAPTPWLVNVGAWRGVDPNWHVAGAVEWIRVAAERLRGGPPRNGRAVPLLALPVVGTGGGGAGYVMGDLTAALVKGLAGAARATGVDVALVTYSDHAHTAAQAARRRLLGDLWAELPSELIALARGLADDARHGRLVLFLGAGISRGAGLPVWSELIDQLARVAGFQEPEALLELADPLDQARVLASRLRSAGTSIGGEIARAFEPYTRCALAHTLLASLPVGEVATTNYDTLFERARTAIERPIASLPYEVPSDGRGWILKLHGSVDHPDDIVLTRDDYLGYGEQRAALRGIVQALLITRRMLFLGFSLTDPNFHQVVHDVRRAVRGKDAAGGAFGTAVLLRDERLLAELWQGDIQIHHCDGDGPVAARRLEIFLDLLLAEATSNTSHLLDPAYDGLLSDEERDLASALRVLAKAGDGEAGRAAGWAQVAELLANLGRRGGR